MRRVRYPRRRRASLPPPAEEMDISPVAQPEYLSPISSPSPVPLQQQQMFFGLEGIPQYFQRDSPELPTLKSPKQSPKKQPKKKPSYEKEPMYELELSLVPERQRSRSPARLPSPKKKRGPSSKGKEEVTREATPERLPSPKKKREPSSKGKEEATPPRQPVIVSRRKKKEVLPFVPPAKVVLPKKESKMIPVPSAPLLQTLTLSEFLTSRGVIPTKAELYHRVNQGENIAPEIANESLVCSMVRDGSLVFGNVLGKGVQGRVNQLLFQNQRGRYAIKSDLNPIIPQCLSNRSLSFNRTDGKGVAVFPSGSLLCTPATSEFAISLMTGEFSRNFINTKYMASCYSGGRIRDQFTLMEQVDGSIRRLFKNNLLNEREINGLYIQILHGLYLCQRPGVNIVHGDLHDDNVFYEVIGRGNSANPDLVNAHYFSYNVEGHTITFPRCSYIAKLADWGFAVKYSSPIIGSVVVCSGERRAIPNFYSAAYDVAFITYAIYIQLVSRHIHSELLTIAMAFILNCRPKDVLTRIGTSYDVSNGRPWPEALTNPDKLSTVNAAAILTNPNVMARYLNFQVPEGETIFRLDHF